MRSAKLHVLGLILGTFLVTAYAATSTATPAVRTTPSIVLTAGLTRVAAESATAKPSSTAGPKAIVRAWRPNVRQGPGVTYLRLTQVKAVDVLEIVGRDETLSV